PFDKDYIEILHMFGDYENSTFSIHNLLQAGEGYALAPGSWVSPYAMCRTWETLARRKIAETEVQDNSSPMAIYVVSGDEDGERVVPYSRAGSLGSMSCKINPRYLPLLAATFTLYRYIMLHVCVVLKNAASQGIASADFDVVHYGLAAVDSTCCEFNRNRLIALMSVIILKEHPGTTLVTESVTSDELTTFIEKKLGGKHHRFKRGYKNLIEEAIRQNSVGGESHLAIQTSVLALKYVS
ncbi:cysteine protease ATG4-like protein isoform X1, partial [Tanacetum coccineum]